MTRKEIRPNQVRLHGTIIPSNNRFIQTAIYEDFHVLRTTGANTTYKDISPAASTNLNTYSKEPITPLSLWNWKPLTGTMASLVEPSVVNGNAINAGTGYLTYLKKSIAKNILNDLSIKITLSFTGRYQRCYLGYLNGTDTLSVTGLNVHLSEYVNQAEWGHSHQHVLEIKFVNKCGYVYVDDVYTQLNFDFSSNNNPVYLCFYGTVQVYNIELETYANRNYDTINLDIALANWTIVPHPTLATTPTTANADGTIMLGQRQYNCYPISDKTVGTKYKLKFYQTSNYALGVAVINNGNVTHHYVTTNSLGSTTLNTDKEYTISYEEDGVYLQAGNNESRIAQNTNDNYIAIYTSSAANTDKLYRIQRTTKVS